MVNLPRGPAEPGRYVQGTKMKRVSIVRAFALISTVIACLMLYFAPGREIYLHSDKVARLDDGSKGDREKWEGYLGRTEYLSQAWKAVDTGNSLWQSKKYTSAVDSWWKTAEQFRDTDAAYASLSNIAAAQHDLKNRQGAMEAMQILLLLPSPTFHDLEMDYANYRHEACVKLADYYEEMGNLSLAERFVYQSIHQDTRRDTCGVYWVSVNTDLENRLQSLLVRQSKQ